MNELMFQAGPRCKRNERAKRAHSLYINVYTVEPLNNGHTRSEVFVLYREVVLTHYNKGSVLVW